MPRPPNNPWGFDAVIEFIGSDCFDVGAREPLSPPRSPHGTGTATDALSPKRKSLKSLGSFTNLFERLGISLDIATPNGPDDPVPSLIDDLGESGDAADSPEDDVDITNSEPDRKTVNDSLAGMSKKKRKRARKRAEKTRKAEELLQVSEERQQLIQIIERKVEKNAQESTKTDLFGKQQSRSNVGAKIRPATPAPQTLSARPREDRHFDFFTKLMEEFPEDKKWLVSPMRLTSDKSSPEGIHIFVDASNILIGFKESLKRTRNPSFDMSFDCLALLLERRRPVAKRVYAGSTRLTGPLASAEKFADLAGDVGYQMDIYEQVYKVREQTESQRFFKDVDRMGWAKATQIRTGSGSDSETGPPPTTPSAPKWVEQGVDESLHLKMCQSILDVEVPSTMVLATGDGAAAEYSDGFLAHVERALKKGWKVELVSWKQQTNGGYKNKKFRAKWGDAFRMIELDEYLQWMVDS
ncbi:hypothetical protein B0J11DRAFT_440919 [Dendryphion nanum]|uniref:NYN domain-containing protein n=1 Tax=Dendryphion nanum TaxID=256645 RepID=A0A9P9IGS6_9PLEO|nr:hypothetical protein B0J11DRAFT_440919 [Dendryphion nanum]